jgi:arylformamidase
MSEQGKWIDVSVPLRTGLVHWPGDPEPTFERISDLEHGAEANVTLCRMTAHTGTHMDAPVHFLPGEVAGIDVFPLELGIGRARVVAVDAPVIGAPEVERLEIRPGDRVLFKTKNSRTAWAEADFRTNYVAVNAAAARILVEKKIGLIGVDYLSVGVYKGDGAETHRLLLSGGVWIVEGLDLTQVDEGEYDLVCLPLRIAGADGAPARVVLRPAS